MRRIAISAAALVPASALAHHPLAGQEMATFGHGLLSGVGHPLLGFDHLLFVALVGVASVFTGHRLGAPAAYVAAMLGGCALVTFGIAPPAIEPAIAASLLILGYLVLSGRALGIGTAIALFALAGLFHGAAFGEAMASAEAASVAPVLAGYLLGLGAVQYLIALAAGLVVTRVWKATEAAAMQPRLAGAAVAGAGLLLTLEAVEGAVFAALGIG